VKDQRNRLLSDSIEMLAPHFLKKLIADKTIIRSSAWRLYL